MGKNSGVAITIVGAPDMAFLPKSHVGGFECSNSSLM